MKSDPLEAIEIASRSSSSSSSAATEKKNSTALQKPREEDDASSSDGEIEYLYEQNFHELRAACLRERRLFEDPEFPADNDLLRVRSARHIDDLEWLRPPEFVRPEEPVLVSEGNEGFDIRVGLDSWFVPAMGAVAESEALLNQVGE